MGRTSRRVIKQQTVKIDWRKFRRLRQLLKGAPVETYRELIRLSTAVESVRVNVLASLGVRND